MTSVVRILSIPIALALMASGCAPESQRVRTPSTNNSPLSIPPQECSAPEEEGSFAQSEAEFEKWSTGVWLLCKPPSIFQTSESGMEISNDGTWWKLVQDSSGQLVRLERWEQRGSWDVFDTSAMNGPGHFELNFSVDGSGAHFTQPKFFSDASRMRINNHGVEADYVRTMRGTAPAPAESPAHHEISPECSAVEGGVARAYTRDDFIGRILGKWLLCGPPSVFGSQEAGLEIGNEGRWWKLVRNETGELKVGWTGQRGVLGGDRYIIDERAWSLAAEPDN